LWAWLSGSQLAAAIAHVGAWINLLNLAPVWQLDGSRAFRALSRKQRWIAVAVLAAIFVLLRDFMIGLVLVTAIVRAFGKDAPQSGDSRTLADFWFLAAALGAVSYANAMPSLAQLK
jgi:Zn-dependent protease